MTLYQSEGDYLQALSGRSLLPEGFTCGHTSLAFTPAELGGTASHSMNASAIVLDEPSPAFAGVFTVNKFPGAPVLIAKERMSCPRLRGILINNKVANVCAPGGLEDAGELLSEFAALTECKADEYIPASTGVIGWRLPTREIIAALPGLINTLQNRTILPVAQAIMTTDRYPKVRSAPVGSGRIVGIAKGAGMIEPRMGTLLAFILTDVDVSRDDLRSIHREVINSTFNRISVDGDQSTSDIALTVSSRRRPATAAGEFRDKLYQVCKELAEDIVRNGEGTAHVVKTSVVDAPTEETAVMLGKAVINSPLVKTAIFGNDPNVGRIIMAIGDFLGTRGVPIAADNVWIELGGHRVFQHGKFSLEKRKEEGIKRHFEEAFMDSGAHRYPAHEYCVEITVGLEAGTAAAEVLGSDLSYGYVKENADYRT